MDVQYTARRIVAGDQLPMLTCTTWVHFSVFANIEEKMHKIGLVGKVWWLAKADIKTP